MPSRSKSTRLKSRANATRIKRARRGRPPRSFRVELQPSQAAASASDAKTFESATDALIVRAIRRGLERGTLVRDADGTIRSRGNA